MTVRYVGPGGNDSNSGLTWALRKLTLNGVEDTPVVAGDTVYVGPGVYRELLTCDVSGTAGNPITYVGDYTGVNTDGVGGAVRLTGSDNDITATRANAIMSGSRNYRTFRGFHGDICSSYVINHSGGTNLIIEDCVGTSTVDAFIVFGGATGSDFIIRRCYFFSCARINGDIYFNNASAATRTGTIENCVFIGYANAVNSTRVGGFTINNCSFIGNNRCVYTTTASPLTAITVNNSIFTGSYHALDAFALGDIVENFNAFSYNSADRTNVSVGANSNTNPPLFELFPMVAGFTFPWFAGKLSQWSTLKALAGTGMSTEDLFGLARPVTDSKKSWGAIQYAGPARSAVQKDAGTYSLTLPDASRVQFFVPVTAVSTTFSVKVYREADYAGTLPQMVIKQPGVADNTTVDTGNAGGFNVLTATLTPAAVPGYVIVELVSNNTATSGSYATYWDTLSVT